MTLDLDALTILQAVPMCFKIWNFLKFLVLLFLEQNYNLKIKDVFNIERKQVLKEGKFPLFGFVGKLCLHRRQ